MDFTTHQFCVDLGSSNIRVGSPKSGVILTQASLGVTFTNEMGEISILALGNSALEMFGRIPKILRHVQLVKDGSINDLGCTIELLRQIFLQLQERFTWMNQHVVVCLDETANEAEKNTVSQLLKQVGVRKIRFVSRLLAIGTALHLPLAQPQAHCIIDIGGHTSEIGVVSCGVVVRTRLIKIGGDAFSLALVRHIRKYMGIEISIRQADKLKEQFGNLSHNSSADVVEVLGKSVADGFPSIQHISMTEVQKGLLVGVEMWLSAVESFFDELPIELSTDIAHTGVVLVGGGAKLGDLDWVLSNRLRLMVVAPEKGDELCLLGSALISANNL